MIYYSSFPLTPENLLTNRAMNYGDGVFETMMVAKGQIPLFDLHIQRLKEGLNRLSINCPKASFIKDKIKDLSDISGYQTAKLVVFRKDSKRSYASSSSQCDFFIILSHYSPSESPDNLTVSDERLSHNKKISGIKHLSRLEQVLAANDCINKGFGDAIVCDQNQNIIETTNKNIILIKNNHIYSPDLSNSGIYGVALRWLQTQLQNLSIDLTFKTIHLNELSNYEGMIVCNSIQGFSLIKNVDNLVQFTQNLPIADRIKSLWSELFKP